jgi:flagellar basal-body rod protein FlgF
MDSGLYAACAGLVARAEAVDTLANNLANVNTNGFRGRHNTFSSVLAQTGSSHLSVLNQDANDYGILSGTKLDTTQGVLQPTGNPMDVAIEGPGYFPVQTATGTVYTRAGNFRVSANHQLTTAQGDPVLGDNGPITVLGTPVSPSVRTAPSRSRALSPAS